MWFWRRHQRLSSFATSLRGALKEAPQQPSAPAEEQNNSAKEKPVPVEVHNPPPDPLTVAQGILRPVLHPLATAAIVFVVAIFILLQRDDLRDRLIRLFGTRDLHRTTLAMDDAAGRLSRFFLVQLGINAGFGFTIAVGLYLIGLPKPILWGILGRLIAVCALAGKLCRRRRTHPAGRGRRARVDQGDIGCRPFPHNGANDWSIYRTAAVRSQHRFIAAFCRHLGHLLGMVVGAHRPDYLNSDHVVFGRARPPYRATGISADPARRSTGPNQKRNLLSAGVGRRSSYPQLVTPAQVVQ